MATYPPRGTPLWDDPLKAYIDVAVGIATVLHGLDAFEPRPNVGVVHWVGSVKPVNANMYDFWSKVAF